MGIFDKLRQLIRADRHTSAAAAPLVSKVVPLDEQLLQELLQQLQEQYPDLKTERYADHLLVAPHFWQLDAAVVERTEHPNAVVLALALRLKHPQHFPAGITDCLAGIGEDDADAIRSGVHSYLISVFSAVLEAYSGGHTPELDMVTDQKLWHPVVSAVQVQGGWNQRLDEVDERTFFQQLRPALVEVLPRLPPQPFHWLKVYASRQPEGEFVGECMLDNQPWETGLALLQQAVAQWPFEDEFAGQKQFIVFRLCGLGATCCPLSYPET